MSFSFTTSFSPGSASFGMFFDLKRSFNLLAIPILRMKWKQFSMSWVVLVLSDALCLGRYTKVSGYKKQLYYPSQVDIDDNLKAIVWLRLCGLYHPSWINMMTTISKQQFAACISRDGRIIQIVTGCCFRSYWVKRVVCREDNVTSQWDESQACIVHLKPESRQVWEQCKTVNVISNVLVESHKCLRAKPVEVMKQFWK